MAYRRNRRPAIKIVIYVEGISDEKALHGLLRNERKEFQNKRHSFEIHQLRGKPNLIKEIGRRTELTLKDKDARAVFAIVDSDDENPEQLIRRLNAAVPQKCRKRFRPHTAVKEIEAWLIADKKVLLSVFKEGNFPKNLAGEPENLRHPKNLIKKIWGQYNPIIHGALAFKQADPDIVAEKCPHFRLFRNDLRAILKNS